MADDLYIGLMSGTSLDGIDAVLVRFNQHQPTLLASHYQPLTQQLKDDIRNLIHPGANQKNGGNELNRMSLLDVQLGEVFADCTLTLLKLSQTPADSITAIGSHGQTIRHLPDADYPSTLQIGDPNTIAEKTNITTVADFRRRDMAAGGQGAPLVSAFHEKNFRDINKNRVILNLGGIANITLLLADKNKPVTGFDTGPANTLMNNWILQHLNKNYDTHGAWAKSGTVNEDFLNALLNDDYFKLKPPKSTGTEYFNSAWLTKKLNKFPSLAAEDVQASLTALTTSTIKNAVNLHASAAEEIIICGGGVHNDFLIRQLKRDLPEIEINSSSIYGLDPDYIEATAFAWLAKQTMEHKSGNLPEVTGAKRAVILGGVYY